MPIYEFYCPGCHTIYNFLSRTVNTTRRPACPRCRTVKLRREVSAFSVTGGAKEGDDAEELPVDESKMERAMNALAAQAENIDEENPRQAAELMRKFSDMTGMRFGKGMEEAMGRMEAGEDPEAIEEQMGDIISDEEEPFLLPGAGQRGGGRSRRRSKAPKRDKTLYEM